MTTERPLGRIRMTRLRANAGGPSEPVGPGRHRRAANTDANQSPAQVRATGGEAAEDEA